MDYRLWIHKQDPRPNYTWSGIISTANSSLIINVAGYDIMDKETQKLISKCFALGGGIVITLYALSLGYDSQLAMYAIVALFGGEKVLDKLLSKKVKRTSLT
jgi:hypothetical protein